MPVLNFQITKIDAHTENKKNVEKVDVKSNFTISSIEKGTDPRIGKYLNVRFRFDVEYSPDVGNISLEGELWYYSKDLSKMILGDTKGKIVLKGEASNEISTAVLHGSLVEAVLLSKKLRLPIPLKLPQISIKQEKMEFAKAS